VWETVWVFRRIWSVVFTKKYDYPFNFEMQRIMLDLANNL